MPVVENREGRLKSLFAIPQNNVCFVNDTRIEYVMGSDQDRLMNPSVSSQPQKVLPTR